MKKILIISILLASAIWSCKKDNTPPSSNPIIHQSSSVGSLIGSWAVDSILYKGTMYMATSANGGVDTLIFTANTVWESQGAGTSNYTTNDGFLTLTRGTATPRTWQYVLSVYNLVLQCDTESQYLHKF